MRYLLLCLTAVSQGRLSQYSRLFMLATVLCFALCPTWAAGLSSVTMTTTPANVALFGNPVTLKATATGGINVQYKFLNGTYVMRNFAGSNTYTFTPSSKTLYTFTVIARDLGGVDPNAAVTSNVKIDIKAPLTAVSLASTPITASVLGKTVTLTATATGGANLQYKFLNGTYVMRDFAGGNTLVFTPSNKTLYTITVIVRDLGGVDPNATVTSNVKIDIKAALTAVSLATTPTTASVLGKSVILTATATGGANLQYKFLNGTYVMRDFASGNTLVFTPSNKTLYTLTVIVRDQGGVDPNATVTSNVKIDIKAALTAVSLASTPVASSILGKPVTLTATAAGGVNVQYKFLYGTYVMRDFASSNTCPWTPTAVKTYSNLTVVARDSGGIDPTAIVTSPAISLVVTAPTPAPTITSFTPTSGPFGQIVTIPVLT